MYNEGKDHLYAVDLGGGSVKVGRTQHPAARLQVYGCDVHDKDIVFIVEADPATVMECEKRVCHLLGASLYRGLEYFKCSFYEARKTIEEVCRESSEGGFSDSDHLETENILFRGFPAGTKAIMAGAAKDMGHISPRQLFCSWIDGLREKK